MKMSFRMLAMLLVLTTFGLTTASCMGSFALTKKLYNWNKNEIGNKWLSSLVLFIFLVLPVYGIAGLIDWIILNVIEFYSGNNPVSANEPATRTAQFGDTTATLTFVEGDGLNLDLTTVDAAGHSKKLIVRSVDEHGMVARLIEDGKEKSLLAARTDGEDGVARFSGDKWEYFDGQDVAETLSDLPAAQPLLQ